MEKTKKRNELSIFEELRLKHPTNARAKDHYPREYDLHKLNILCKLDELKELFKKCGLIIINYEYSCGNEIFTLIKN